LETGISGIYGFLKDSPSIYQFKWDLLTGREAKGFSFVQSLIDKGPEKGGEFYSEERCAIWQAVCEPLLRIHYAAFKSTSRQRTSGADTCEFAKYVDEGSVPRKVFDTVVGLLDPEHERWAFLAPERKREAAIQELMQKAVLLALGGLVRQFLIPAKLWPDKAALAFFAEKPETRDEVDL
jgi:hypothetical protein